MNVYIPPFLGNVAPSPGEILSIVTPWIYNELCGAQKEDGSSPLKMMNCMESKMRRDIYNTGERRDAEVDPIDREQSGLIDLNIVARLSISM